MESIRGIILASGEKVIRTYEATRLEAPKTNGILIATNRRLIFTGEGQGLTGTSIMNREVQIEKVSGIQGFYGRGMNKAVIIMAILVIVIGFIVGNISDSIFIPIAGLALAAFMIYRMIKNPGNQFYLGITADNQSQSSINVTATAVGFMGSFFNRFGGSHAWMAVNAGPAQDTERMIRELGALVLDIQAQGDLAAERWLNNEKESYSRNIIENTGPSITCPSCKTIMKEALNFCEKCGSPLKSDPVAAAPVGSQTNTMFD